MTSGYAQKTCIICKKYTHRYFNFKCYWCYQIEIRQIRQKRLESYRCNINLGEVTMREIKFRAWLINEKKLIYDFDISSHKMICFQTSKRKVKYLTINKEVILQQYTELKDKKNKEIYEGDILIKRYKTGKEIPNTRSIVFWNKDFALFEPFTPDQESSDESNIEENDEYEIIGNIYEDKDLIPEGYSYLFENRDGGLYLK